MSQATAPKFIILAILDGWGIAPEDAGNAIKIANPQNFNKFWVSYPHCELEASGEAVGLPSGEDGNTETGHLNLGAGKVVYQSIKRIDLSISDGSFFKNEVLNQAFDHALKNNSDLHLMGLIGAGGVHSNLEHLFALVKLASEKKFNKLYLHLFTDGRDSPPMSAKTYIKNIVDVLESAKTGKLASVMGRYWAMDRDQRWDRTEKAYLALTKGTGNHITDIYQAIDSCYKKGITDEFIEPSILIDKDSKPISLIKENDAVIFFNFRVDRPRQLTKAFVLNDFSKANYLFDNEAYSQDMDAEKNTISITNRKEPFVRGKKISNLFFVTMTQYNKSLTGEGASPAFPPEVVEAPLSMIVSNAGLRQLKITESEKERFVTFYFNGMREKPFPMEERVIIPSPKVPTYDQKPEMSAYEMTDTLIKKLKNSEYDLVILNFPNPDMVGHTGNLGATVKAINIVDECVGKLANFTLAYGGMIFITADHGNAEELINKDTGQIDTEHSSNRVPFIAVSERYQGKFQTLRAGKLADIAPTILNALGLIPPGSMTGRDLLHDLTF